MTISTEFFGFLSSCFGLISFSLYFRELFLRKIRPHAFSWFIWGLSGGVVLAAQIAENAGPIIWIFVLEVIGCSVIFCWSLLRGETGYVLSDWIALALALCSILLWWLTKTPLFAVILITVIEIFAFYPTFRKSYFNPFEESLSAFMVNGFKLFASLFAIDHYLLTTALYPFSLFFMNAALVGMLFVRRRQVLTHSPSTSPKQKTKDTAPLIE